MNNKFQNRSDEKEFLDLPGIPKELLFRNLHELDVLNRRLGGHFISLQGIKKLVTDKDKTYHIADLGCGSGDTMKYFADWARSAGYKVKLTGVDMNADAIEYLHGHCSNYKEIKGIISDYHHFLRITQNIDILHCSLFCHHLNDLELTELLRWANLNTQTGFVINDLQRNWLAYYSAWGFTRIFNGSLLAKNDGPISVLRGFKLSELENILTMAGIEKYSIKRKPGFRYLIVGKTMVRR
jgi:hypothetical protein